MFELFSRIPSRFNFSFKLLQLENLDFFQGYQAGLNSKYIFPEQGDVRLKFRLSALTCDVLPHSSNAGQGLLKSTPEN